MDWSQNSVCVRCNESGDLLMCNACPLVIHEGCMKCSAEVDELGNFYCPHCFLKRCVAEMSQAKKNVKLTKKALSVFLGDSEEHDNEAEPGPERVPQSETGAANVRTSAGHWETSEDGIGDAEGVKEGEETGDVEGEKIQGEGSETPLASTGQTYEESTEKSEEETEGEKIQDEKSETPLASTDLTYEESTEKIGEETEGEKIQEEKSETPLASTDQTRKSNSETYEASTDKSGEQELSSKDKDLIGVEYCENSSDPTGGNRLSGRLKAKRRILIGDSSCEDNPEQERNAKESNIIEQSSPAVKRRTHSAQETSKSSGEEFDDSGSESSKWIHPKRPSVTLDNNIGFKQPRRVFWTKEEVKMLKAGVEKFSSPAKKNLPWRKILDFGRHVFNKIRTPEDLKEKWRRIT